MSPVQPERRSFCWHQREFETICTRLQTSSVLLVAGRGLGKTRTLDRIQHELDPLPAGEGTPDADRKKSVVRINGAAKGIAREKLEGLKENRNLRFLIIDDVDNLMTPESSDTLQGLEPLLSLLTELALDRARAVLSTTLTGAALYEREKMMGTSDPRWAAPWINKVSTFFQRLDLVRLQPWSPGWRRDFEQDFHLDLPWSREVISPRPHSPARSGKHTAAGSMRTVEKIWLTNILELTGRYPSLAHEAIEFVRNLLEHKNASPHLESLVQPWDDSDSGRNLKTTTDRNRAVKTAIEDALSSTWHLRAIRKAIQPWQEATDGSIENKVFRMLESIALSGDAGLDPAHVNDPQVREFLRMSGLCYTDADTGFYIVPGSLIRQEILGKSLGLLVESDGPHSDSGRLRGYGLEQFTVELTGALWTTLNFLYKRRGEDKYWSLEEIRDGTKALKERAVQNAIQRLQQALAKQRDGLEACIANRRGEGYRFVGLTSIPGRPPAPASESSRS